MNNAPQRQLEPFVTSEQAERLAHMIASFPLPETVGDAVPSDEFVQGFREAQRIACIVAMAAGGEDGSTSGCAPVASRP